MGMEDYTPYQQGIIKRYYANLDQVSWQRLSELVADLYLAEGKKREKLWASAVGYMQKLKIPPARIHAIAAAQDIEALAQLVKELMNKK
ncbi:MAG: hypothetical protein RMJ56_00440 [Gemmataceae bacterium]|nr:hypothetical protein [Gemmata sp.]MDW8196048.1 hypothetical protein [Gemmataceae bacterium]